MRCKEYRKKSSSKKKYTSKLKKLYVCIYFIYCNLIKKIKIAVSSIKDFLAKLIQ